MSSRENFGYFKELVTHQISGSLWQSFRLARFPGQQTHTSNDLRYLVPSLPGELNILGWLQIYQSRVKPREACLPVPWTGGNKTRGRHLSLIFTSYTRQGEDCPSAAVNYLPEPPSACLLWPNRARSSATVGPVLKGAEAAWQVSQFRSYFQNA
jgi:hypothetical protein